jgi:tetratricopeptide (TPR) repeat protein
MKFGSMTKVVAGVALALLLAGGETLAHGASGAQADQKADQADQKAPAPALYPNATRQEPQIDLTEQADADALNKGLDAVNAHNAAVALQILQPFADGTGSKSKYVQAMALQGLASLKYNQQDIKGAIDLQKKALAIGILPNDTYYQLMYMLAQYYVADQQYAQAMTTLQQWRSEGKRETADSYGLEGNIDYRLQKYPEAIAAIKKAESMTDKPKASWTQILTASYAESGQGDQALQLAQQQLTADPTDATTMHNAIALLVQSKKYPEALKLMERARSSGTLTQEQDYVNMAKLYMVIAQNGTDTKANAAKAGQVIDEGMSKGIVKPGYATYMLQGNAAYIGGDDAKAIAAYAKAAPLGTDGEADLRRGQLLLSDGKTNQGKRAVKTAISKGVKHAGTAWMLVAEAERTSKNKPAAIKAMKMAAQDPETRARAKAWLKTAGH